MSYYLKQVPSVPGMKTFAKAHPTPMGIILTKNSPLLPILSMTLLQLQEKGIIYRALSEFQTSGSEFVEQNVLVLSAGQTALAFVMLAVGSLLVFVVVVAEILIAKHYSHS